MIRPSSASFVVLAVVSLLTIAPIASVALASAPSPEPESDDPPPSAVDLDLVLDEVLVEARRESPLTGRIDSSYLTSTPSANLSEALVLLPGISAVGRGAKSLEPVVRGQGWERVATEVGCVPVYGACPARMDPPATYIQPHAVETVEVSKGLGSLATGTDGIGGTIRIPTDYERSPQAPSSFESFSTTAYDAVRSGFRLESGIRGGGASYDLRASGAWSRFRDYDTPSGIAVPASQEEMGASFSLGFRPTSGQRVYGSLDYTHGRDVDFPSLPMDSRDTDYVVGNVGYRWDRVAEHLRQVTLEGGVAAIDHVMDNRDKANRAVLEAETPSEARTYAGRVRLGIHLDPNTQLAAGAKVDLLTRDAVRTRFLPATGQTFRDHLWPDASQLQSSLFFQVDRSLRHDWTAALGARVGVTRSEASAVDDASLGGKTIAEQYIRFYGTDAMKTDRTEGTYGAEMSLTWKPAESFRAYGGLDVATRPAAITERYFAFGPAPGGFQVGDPSLDMEQKWGVEAGVDWSRGFLDVGVSAYHQQVHDYILSTSIAQMDVNGDGISDRVRGFENVPSRFQGFEAALLAGLHSRVQVPVTISFVAGENVSGDRPLPEMPPLEGTAAIRTRLGMERRLRLELGARFAGAQSRIDPQFGEDATPAWVSWRIESAYRVRSALRLEVGIENLFDAEYHEHLTRESLMKEGGLLPGSEIAAPGRAVYVVVEASY